MFKKNLISSHDVSQLHFFLTLSMKLWFLKCLPSLQMCVTDRKTFWKSATRRSSDTTRGAERRLGDFALRQREMEQGKRDEQVRCAWCSEGKTHGQSLRSPESGWYDAIMCYQKYCNLFGGLGGVALQPTEKPFSYIFNDKSTYSKNIRTS